MLVCKRLKKYKFNKYFSARSSLNNALQEYLQEVQKVQEAVAHLTVLRITVHVHIFIMKVIITIGTFRGTIYKVYENWNSIVFAE